MIAIYKKEINLFFSSLIAYMSMLVFFIVLGLNLFVFEGNILDNGYYFILPSFIKFIEHAYQYYDF